MSLVCLFVSLYLCFAVTPPPAPLRMSLTDLLFSLLFIRTLRRADKVQGLYGQSHGHTGPPRGEAGPRNPEAHQLGSGTEKSEKKNPIKHDVCS